MLKMRQIRPTTRRGFLVVFEGIDRSGKTTQAKMIYDRLIREGSAAAMFRFPDRSTATGKILNSYLSSGNSESSRWSPQLLHLLFSANRWEAQPKLYEALSRGDVVIVDRYSFSGVAYSTGAAPAVAAAAVKKLQLPSTASDTASDAVFAAAEAVPSAFAAAAAASIPINADFCLNTEQGLLAPDLVIYLDLRPQEACLRCNFGSELYEKLDVQEKVYDAYKQFQHLRYWHSVAVGQNATAAELHEKIYQIVHASLSASKDAGVESLSSRTLLWDT